jgi:hypothetical protein
MTVKTSEGMTVESIDLSKSMNESIGKNHENTDDISMTTIPLKLPDIVLNCLKRIAKFAGMDISTYICDEILVEFFSEFGLTEERLMSYLLTDFCKADKVLRKIYHANREKRRCQNNNT